MFMSNKNVNQCKCTNLRIENLVLPDYTNPSMKYFSYIKYLVFFSQNKADMFRDLADAIMTLNPKVKNKISFYSFL